MLSGSERSLQKVELFLHCQHITEPIQLSLLTIYLGNLESGMIHVARILPFTNHRSIGIWASAQYRFYGKMGNKISNIAADVFVSRTSLPYFLKEKEPYLLIESGDQEIHHKTSEVLDAFMLDHIETKDRLAIVKEYYDPWTVARLLAILGL
jgi:hypothetical protein